MITATQNPLLHRIEDAILKFPEVASLVESARSTNERLKAFAALGSLRRLLDDATKWVKSQEEALGPDLLEDMAVDGLTSVNVEIDGQRFNVHQRTDFWCNKKADKEGVTTQDVCDALEDCGLGDMVSDGYSAASVKARVKEWVENGVEIPAQLAKVLRWGSETKLVSTK